MSTITHDYDLTNKQKDMDKFNLIPQTIVKASVIEALKRLQLEINDSEEIRNKIMWENFSRPKSEALNIIDGKTINDLIAIQSKNTARIAEIILNEL